MILGAESEPFKLWSTRETRNLNFMKKIFRFFFGVAVLLMGGGLIFGQGYFPYSPDSLIFFKTHEAPDHTTKLNWSDSLWVIQGTDTLRVYSNSDTCEQTSGCDSLYYYELFSPCMVFWLPRLVRCVKLEDDLYALLGYTTQHPFHIKHIWILEANEQLRITQKIALATRRTLEHGIVFEYDAQKREIIVHANEVALLDEHLYLLDQCQFEQQKPEAELQTYQYNIWVGAEDGDQHMQEGKDRVFRVGLYK